MPLVRRWPGKLFLSLFRAPEAPPPFRAVPSTVERRSALERSIVVRTVEVEAERIVFAALVVFQILPPRLL